MVIEGEAPRPGARRWLWLVVVLALGALGAVWGLRRGASEPDLRGVRLGLTASDTRTRFQAPGAGSWASEASGEPTLRWTAREPASAVHEAVFEFHQGMLVAVRLRLDAHSPEAEGPALEVTPARVVAREHPAGGEALVTVLSRSCPAHADEVRRLLDGARH